MQFIPFISDQIKQQQLVDKCPQAQNNTTKSWFYRRLHSSGGNYLMGSARRPRPKRLAEKLLAVRNKIDGGLSQNELIRRLGLENGIERERISKFERGVLEPPLYILCAYADAANIYLEVIVKDEFDLPDKLPAKKAKSF